jgi:pyruvate carboxylase
MAPGKSVTVSEPPFKKLMAANRGEIATRISRGASELGIQTVGIYSHEGKNKVHVNPSSPTAATACASESCWIFSEHRPE